MVKFMSKKNTKPYTKYQVKYESEASNPKEHCVICEHYINKNKCELVQGKINPEGWCNKFDKIPTSDKELQK